MKSESTTAASQGTEEPEITAAVPPSPPSGGQWELRIACLWLALAVAGFAAGAIGQFHRPFTEGGGPYFGLAARSFVRDGIVALHGVPLLNNPPQGTEPDWYIHWPPLFNLFLAMVYRWFGESAASSHALMLGAMLLLAAAMYAAVSSCRGKTAGVWAAFAALVLPPTFKFGYYVVTQTLAVPLTVLALWGFFESTRTERFRRGWALVGALFLVLATLTTWEPVLTAFGLVAIALILRDRRRIKLAIAYFGAACATVVLVLAYYLRYATGLGRELFSILMFRMGHPYASGEARVHGLADHLAYGGFSQPTLRQLLMQYANDIYMLGPIALLALGALITWTVRKRRSPEGRTLATLVLGLLSAWILWLMFMRNHAYIHPQQTLLAVPGAAAAIGVMAACALEWSDRLSPELRATVKTSMLLFLPAVLLMGMAREIMTLPPYSDAPMNYMRLGLNIKDSTPAGAVVLTTNESRSPVYYSERQVVLGVSNDAVLATVQPRLKTVFPGAPIFLALQERDLSSFPLALAHDRTVSSSPDFVLLKLEN